MKRALKRYIVFVVLVCNIGCHGKLTQKTNSNHQMETPNLPHQQNNDKEDIQQPKLPTTHIDESGVRICEKKELPFGVPLLRRLTRNEYENSVRSIFLLDKRQWSGSTLPLDPAAASGLLNDAYRRKVTFNYASKAWDSAKMVASSVVEANSVAKGLSCYPQKNKVCARAFLNKYGRRIYRRPMSTAEQSAYLALLEKTEDLDEWLKISITTMLNSPYFLYRHELGQANAEESVRVLTQYERASLIAYHVTGLPPDETLLQMADEGRLKTPEQIEAAAKSLAFDASGQMTDAFLSQLQRFARQYIGYASVSTITKHRRFSTFNAAVAASMEQETQHYLAYIFKEGGGPDMLLTSKKTFVDETLAEYYGFTKTTNHGGFEAIDRPDGQGVGLLAQGSFLATTGLYKSTSPTQRGVFVLNKLLCIHPPTPPEDIPELPDLIEADTTRELYEKMHAAKQPCSDCHALFDPIGYGLEHFDTDGRFRAKENGFEIDPTGTLVGQNGVQIPFENQEELAGVLANDVRTHDCIAVHMAGDAYGIGPERTWCQTQSLRKRFAQKNVSLVQFYLDLLTTPHALKRQEASNSP